MKIVIPLLLILLFSACATVQEDNYVTLRAKTQCPINYHLQQTTITKSNKNKNVKNKEYTVEFKCVADSDSNTLLGHN